MVLDMICPVKRLKTTVRSIHNHRCYYARSTLRLGLGWTVVVLSAVLVTVRWQWRTDPVPFTPDTPDYSCGDVFRLSRRRYSWEPPAVAAGPGGCRVRPLQPGEVGDRLRLRAAATARPTELVFIGDSRMRIIFKRVTDRLRLTPYQRSSDASLPGSPTSSNLTGAPAECTEAFQLLLSTEKRLGAPPTSHMPCSLRAGGESLKLHYWYPAPYLTRSFDATAAALAARCRSQPHACPSLVVFNTGVWYARRFSITIRASAADWVLRFRRDLAGRRPTLHHLAAATSLLWKLEEPIFSREVEGRRPDMIMSILPVMQALMYAEAARVPGLTVWSGALPESGRYQRRMCGTWPRRPGEPQQTPSRDTGDCRDSYHVGRTVLDGQTDAIFNYLCREAGVRPRDSRFCCGAT